METPDQQKMPEIPAYGFKLVNVTHEVFGAYKGVKGVFVVNKVVWHAVHFIDMNV